jgi:regulator of protease activity HflC (stomatin/prohibitin superfamily)
MFGITQIKKHEIGLLFRRGDFVRILRPGRHFIIGAPLAPGRDRVEVFNTLDTLFVHALIDMLVKEPAVADVVLPVDLGDHQRALIWRDGRLGFILGPGRHALWRHPFELRVELFDVDRFRLEHPRIEAILAHRDANRWLSVVEVEAHQELIVFRNGNVIDRLTEGKYVFWKVAGTFAFRPVDRREQIVDIAGQEIMTNDKVTLRVNLVVAFQVAEAVKAVTNVVDHVQALYREAQLALRAAIGGRTLDALLADKEAIGTEVREALVRRAREFGVAVRGVGLRDIILPGDMKVILNQVIAAEKQAQANLIKRREETAAARSQANTARLLAENPVLARIKELELLGEILAGTKATFVLGDGDLLERVRGLIAARTPAAEAAAGAAEKPQASAP